MGEEQGFSPRRPVHGWLFPSRFTRGAMPFTVVVIAWRQETLTLTVPAHSMIHLAT